MSDGSLQGSVGRFVLIELQTKQDSVGLQSLGIVDKVKVLPAYSRLVLLPLFDYLLLEAGEEASEGTGRGVSQGDGGRNSGVLRVSDSSRRPRRLVFSGRDPRSVSCSRLEVWARLAPVKLSLLVMALVLLVQDDLTGRPDAVVIACSFFVPRSLQLAWDPGPAHLLLQGLAEALFHVYQLSEPVGGSSIEEVIVDRESAPVLRTLWTLLLILSFPAAAMSSLPSFCSPRSLSSQALPPAAVAMVWPGASPSSLPDHCGNLGWGQSPQRAPGAWESASSRTHNPPLHFLSPPSLCKGWAVVV